jgi:hypothetical protein
MHHPGKIIDTHSKLFENSSAKDLIAKIKQEQINKKKIKMKIIAMSMHAAAKIYTSKDRS